MTDNQLQALLMDLAAEFRRLKRISRKKEGVPPALWLKTLQLGEGLCEQVEQRNNADWKGIH